MHSVIWLQEGVFTNMHQLKTLTLTNNTITFVEPRVFDESSNLSSLSSIDLSNNDMTELEPWPFIRAQHRPMFVGLGDNSITTFTNALQWSFNCTSPRISETRLDVSHNYIQHITDVISAWNIDGTKFVLSSLTTVFIILPLFWYTLWVIRHATILLSVTSPNVDRFSKCFHWQTHW